MTRPRMSPRCVAAAWAAWAWATCIAYLGESPTALSPVSVLLPHGHLSTVWAIVAVLLTAGAALPARNRLARVGRALRSIGVVLLTAGLAAWAATYLLDSIVDGGRMWVSGKNYLALTGAAIASSAFIARSHAPEVIDAKVIPEVHEEAASDGD